MKRLVTILAIATPLVVSAGCQGSFADIQGAGSRLTVELVPLNDGDDLVSATGTRVRPIPLSVATPLPYRIVVKAIDPSGNTDSTFNGFVEISAKPGSILTIDAPGAAGRNLKLTNGVSAATVVNLQNPYGETFILASDNGYQPVDPLSDPPPQCADGLDNDGDGKIDYPADEGCSTANDNSEDGGSYSTGSSPPIFFGLPRIADVRGLRCDDAGLCSGNGATPYPRSAIQLDTGYHQKESGGFSYDYDMVVTRISSDGFYVGDPKDSRGGFNGLFAFNFNSPPGMRVCDRLKTLAGTASEFFGFTQLSYPTWTLEEWDPQRRPCLVPEPRVLSPLDVPSVSNSAGNLLPLTGTLVRALTQEGTLEAKVTPKFGPDFPQQNGNSFVITENATNCDLNKDGSIDFTTGVPEQICAKLCQDDPECTEYSNFASRSTFRITITDLKAGTKAPVQADATASALFKPVENKGKVLKSFSGVLTYFSGGSQFTIEARCPDDIVTDLNAQPLPSDKACVYPRTVFQDESQ